jgi:hypothetical protein
MGGPFDTVGVTDELQPFRPHIRADDLFRPTKVTVQQTVNQCLSHISSAHETDRLIPQHLSSSGQNIA